MVPITPLWNYRKQIWKWMVGLFSFGGDGLFLVLLLMEETLHHLLSMKPCEKWGYLPYQNQLFTPDSVHQTVFRQNSAPPKMMMLPVFIGFLTIPDLLPLSQYISFRGYSSQDFRQVSALLYPGIHRLTWRSWGNLVNQCAGLLKAVFL